MTLKNNRADGVGPDRALSTFRGLGPFKLGGYLGSSTSPLMRKGLLSFL